MNKTVAGGLTWNANGTLQQLNITDAYTTANDQTAGRSVPRNKR